MSFFNTIDILIDRLSQRDRKEGKQGAFFGIFLPSFLSVIGVITFLKLPHFIGSCGIYGFTSILLIALMINLLTACSIAAIATNLNFKTGGVYTLLSRCFGAQLGVAVSIPLYFSQVINIAFCLIALIDGSWGKVDALFRGTLGAILLATMVLSSLLSQKRVRLLQAGVFAAVFFVIAFCMVAARSLGEPVGGIVEIKPFWVVFGLFYPALTGFESALFSIDQLKEPSKTFPISLIAAVVAAFFFYWILALYFSWNFERSALLSSAPLLLKAFPHMQPVMILIAATTWIYASSCCLNAPKLMKAMGQDALYPQRLKQAIQGGREELFAWAFTLFFSWTLFLFFDLEMLSPLLTQFFLLTYAMINLACLFEAYMQNPSFRPTFQVHYIYPLVGVVLSFTAMAMMNIFWTWSAILLVISTLILLQLKDYSQNFDDVRQSVLLYIARFATYRLSRFDTPSARSWRPQLICFSQNLTQMTPTIRLAKALTQDKGLLIVASSLRKDVDEDKIQELKRIIRDFFCSHEVHALIELVAGHSIDELIHQMIYGYGLGPIKPNTMLFSYNLDAGSNHAFPKWMQEVQSGQKNGLILCFSPQKISLCPAIKKRIEIVIDQEERSKLYFLCQLAWLLKKSAEYHQASIQLTVICHHQEAIDSLTEYYRDFCQDHRFEFEVIVSPKRCKRDLPTHLVVTCYRDFSTQIEEAKIMAQEGSDVLFVKQSVNFSVQ